MAFTKKTVRDIDVDGKRVLVRVDFNVPIKDGVVGDTTRIKAALPTINYLVEHNARVILMSHLGRPEGTGFQPELSLEPVAKKLAELSGLDVAFVADTYGEKAAEAVAAVEPGKVLVLENVRFDKREKKNDPEIAKKLASYGDVFVLDAFGTAHRAQGSVVGPAAYLPAVAGFLLEKEVDTLTGIFAEPERPFVAIVGGSKVSSKIGVLDHLIDSADTLIIGGGMAYTFFLAQGLSVGQSLKEEDWVERAGEMLKKAEEKLKKAEDTLEERKLVDRAKGLLMDKADFSEQGAFRWIQKTSMDQRIPKKRLAMAIIAKYGEQKSEAEDER